MKKIVFSAYLLMATCFSGQAQCLLDLGPDRYACGNLQGTDTLDLGDQISHQNTVGSLTYTWEAHYFQQLGSTTIELWASDLLDDTTSANPQYIAPLDSVQFFLTLSDSQGNTCSDSMVVYLSSFVSTLGTINASIQEGDSIFLNFGSNISGGTGPLTYLWRPNHGLVDSTLADGFWAKPSHSIAYYATVSDTVGCSAVGAPYYYITVNPLSEKELRLADHFKVYPNPSSGVLFIESNLKELRSFKLIRADGRTVLSLDHLPLQLDLSGYSNGLYWLQVNTARESLSKRLVLQN
ncbi:T9SS type A sorting domain-containing protein [Croceimicrobium sp.]|uniref:T9SS type A sorting domain-containing protein n=1 Tax=Croceimicrobium sp. TaxID=2828340 RepID=UPI003BABCEB7